MTGIQSNENINTIKKHHKTTKKKNMLSDAF
jgi:hypothetical protein